MNLPKENEEYLFTSESYPMINNLRVKIKQAKNNFIRMKVLDNKFLENQLNRAKKHQKEFNDWENTLELFPFVSKQNNRLIKDPEICLFSLDKFHRQCEKITN